MGRLDNPVDLLAQRSTYRQKRNASYSFLGTVTPCAASLWSPVGHKLLLCRASAAATATRECQLEPPCRSPILLHLLGHLVFIGSDVQNQCSSYNRQACQLDPLWCGTSHVLQLSAHPQPRFAASLWVFKGQSGSDLQIRHISSRQEEEWKLLLPQCGSHALLHLSGHLLFSKALTFRAGAAAAPK